MTASTTKTVSTVHLSDLICDVKPGFAVGERDPGGVIQVRMNNVDTDGNLDLVDVIRVPATDKQIGDCSLTKGDVLFNNTNSTELVGKSAVFRGYKESVTFSNHFTRFRVAPKRLDPYYLARWLTQQQKLGVFQGLCTRWVGQSAVRSDKVLGLKIPLPSLPEQRRISDILDKAEMVRRKRLEATQRALLLPLSCFYEMFGSPLSNDREWPLHEIGQLAKVTKLAGFEYTKHFTYRNQGEIIAVRGVNVKKGRLKLDDVHYIDRDVSNRLPRSQLCEGDIVMTYIGVNMGDVAYVPVSKKYHLGPNVAKLTSVDYRTLHPLYLMQFLEIYKSEIARKATNTAKAAFNMSNIRQVRIPVPPGDVQASFAEYYVASQKAIDCFGSASNSSKDLVNSLVQRAFRGEL